MFPDKVINRFFGSVTYLQFLPNSTLLELIKHSFNKTLIRCVGS